MKKELRRQFFPFGRGDRGSRQRLILELIRWGGAMTVYEVRVKVLQTHDSDLTVCAVGMSILRVEGRKFFVVTNFKRGFRAFAQAVKNFSTIHRTNKLWKQKRRLYGGTGR